MLSEDELRAGKTFTFPIGAGEAYLFWNVFAIRDEHDRMSQRQAFAVEEDGKTHERQLFATYDEAVAAVEALRIKYARETAIIALGLHKKRRNVS